MSGSLVKRLIQGGVTAAIVVAVTVLLGVGGVNDAVAAGDCPGAAADTRKTLPAPTDFAEKVFEVSGDGCLNAVATLTAERTSVSQFNVKFLMAHGDAEFVPQASAVFSWFAFFGLSSDLPNVITSCDFTFRNPDGSIPSSGVQPLSATGFADVPFATGQLGSLEQNCTVDFDPCAISELRLTSYLDVKTEWVPGDPQPLPTDPNAAGFDRASSVAVLPITTPGACSVLCDGMAVTINMQLGATGNGTAGDDVILGTDGNDVINGNDGNDTICGQGGDDTITGDDGNDRLFGNTGVDLIRGGPDTDTIEGGPGNDRLLGGTGGDTIDGGEGNDYIGGFGGDDVITGGPGNETIFGGFGADTIDGGPGADNIRGLIGDDVINGGDGDDKIFGDRGNDVLSGDGGDDIVEGGNAVDKVNGNDGDDTLSGGKRDDVLNGGAGTDICIGNAHIVADIAIDCETEFGIP